MRLKSSIFVSALIRKLGNDGAFCSVLNKGAEEAGAIFICHSKSRDNNDFYGPVSQSLLPQEHQYDRYFELLNTAQSDVDISQYIQKQKRFDPDIWVVEIETSAPMTQINIIADDTGQQIF